MVWYERPHLMPDLIAVSISLPGLCRLHPLLQLSIGFFAIRQLPLLWRNMNAQLKCVASANKTKPPLEQPSFHQAQPGLYIHPFQLLPGHQGGRGGIRTVSTLWLPTSAGHFSPRTQPQDGPVCAGRGLGNILQAKHCLSFRAGQLQMWLGAVSPCL